MNQDSRQTAETRRESEAVTNARGRIALLAQTDGTLHPDYATALNQLALLFIMQGEPDSAEPLLREALQCRRQTLGESHPDFATNLSSLGGLLWARGDLDAAEPLLRQAVAIRCATLGATHPKSVVSINSLDQLLKSRREIARPASEAPASAPAPRAAGPPEAIVRLGPMVRPEHLVRPGTPFPSSTSALTSLAVPSLSRVEPIIAPAPTTLAAAVSAASTHSVTPVATAVPTEESPGVAESVAARLEEVRGTFTALAGQLETAAEHLTQGRPPVVELIERSRSIADLFERLRGVAAAAAHGLDVPTPAGGFDTLDAIASAVPRLRTAEEAHSVSGRKKAESLQILDRADRLTCPHDPSLAALATCLHISRQARRAIAQSTPGETPVESERLLDGAHPIVALLGLVEADEATPDAQWAAWFDTVESDLGHAVAVAAARAKLILGDV